MILLELFDHYLPGLDRIDSISEFGGLGLDHLDVGPPHRVARGERRDCDSVFYCFFTV